MTVTTNNSPVAVLIDRNIDYRRYVTEPATQPKTVQWGPKEYEVEIVGWRYKKPLGAEHAWINGEVACLPTIARLTREGRLKLYTSTELQCEGWSAEQRIPWGDRGDLFEGIDVQKVPDAVMRSYFESTIDLKRMVDKATVQRFCARLIEFDIAALRETAFWTQLPDRMRRNLENLDRFRFLCKKVGKAHYPDALHFWTAETHGLEYFLTLDRRFLKIAARQRGFVESTKPASPSKLLHDFGITDGDPFPADGADFHSAM